MPRKIRIKQSQGHILAHDILQSLHGGSKQVVLARGHAIQSTDIAILSQLGQKHIYITEPNSSDVYEEEAAYRLATAFVGDEISISKIDEGYVKFLATMPGLLKINTALLSEINSFDDIILFTRHNNTACTTGMVVAGTKIIPLYTHEAGLKHVEELCGIRGKVLKLLPYIRRKVGIVIVSDKVANGTGHDQFSPILRMKLGSLGAAIFDTAVVPDDESAIAEVLRSMSANGAEVICVCGGLSVNPNHMTLDGIERSGAKIVARGVPVMPGSMCTVAYLGDTAILGVPSCFLRNNATAIDTLLSRMLAGDSITREDIALLGHGGMCLECQSCDYPHCPFCK